MANLILNVNKDMFRQLWPTLGKLIITKKNGEKMANLILNVNKDMFRQLWPTLGKLIITKKMGKEWQI